MYTRTYFVYLIIFSFLIKTACGQIVINEYVPSNVTEFANTNGAYNDWIEIYNSGGSPVNLQGYGLSTDSLKPYKFTFPNYTLNGNSHSLVFLANENDTIIINHWEAAIKSDLVTSWQYFVGVSQPDTNWRNLTFNDAGWLSGVAGIGYGDSDDSTTILSSARSVMMRKSFTISDTSEILKAIFSIDYDDGFVAFLNGHEIARDNLGVRGNRPVYNDLSNAAHEALMYQGLLPGSFTIDPNYLKSIIIPGTNVLAVEVHNESPTSSDLSAIPFLTFGIKGSNTMFLNSTPPPWFNFPVSTNFSANFKLSKLGSGIFLTNPSGILIDEQHYYDMQSDHSFGRIPDGSNNWCLINTPTPSASNNFSNCYIGYTSKPIFSLASGFYLFPQLLYLTSSTLGASIYFTTNGDVPSTSSRLYTGPIYLSASQTIRARVFAAGYLPCLPVTNTYVINEDVHLPVFSITTDSLNLWDYNTGIYVLGPNASPVSPFQGANFWQDWEKPATIEYFDKQKNRVFSFDADIKIYGNYSRAKPQKSFELKLNSKTLSGNFKYPFYTDKTSIDNIDNIVLRNSGTDWNVVHFRDAFMERVLKPTYTGYLAAEPAVVYLNGAFWGVYCINENHDHHWMNNNYGLSRNDIDYLKEYASTIAIQEGSDQTYWEMYNYAITQNPLTNQYYEHMDSVLDLKNHVDYFSAEIFYNNGDWIGNWTNNIQLWRKNTAGSKWRYLVYDLDFGLGLLNSVNDDRLAIARDPVASSYSSNIFNVLLFNPSYKRYFINRFADLMNTIFLPSEMLPIMHQFQDSMAFDMNNHFAKWGGNAATWQSNINSMESFINARPAIMRNQIQSQFALNQQVSLTFDAYPIGAGRIQISTVIPATYPWTGVYFDGNPVSITAIPNPGYSFDHWSSNFGIFDPNQTTTYNFSHSSETIIANFTGSYQTPQLVISEFNYHSDSLTESGDWLELHNYGSFTVDLSGWVIKDQNEYNSYVFPVGTVIAPNSYLVISSDLSKFSTAFPSVNNYIGPLGFNLSNAGDQIRLFTHTGQLYLSFFYQTIQPWPPSADGFGYTCELSSNLADLNDGNSWFIGCKGGSPGMAYTTALATATHLTGNTSFCPGSSTALYLNYTPGYNYQWRRNNIDIPSATDTVYTATQAGNYTVFVSYQGCSGISDTLAATIVFSGQPPVVYSNSRCGEGSLVLTGSAPDSIYWFDAPNGTILGTGTSFNTPTLASTTVFYAQTSLSCPSTPVPVTAVIYPIPATPVVNDLSICGPGVIVVNASDTATVNWYNDAVTGALIYTGNIFVTGYIPHDTIFYAEAFSTCASERVALNVSVTSPALPVTNDVSRCGPGSLVLTALSAAPVFWYDSLIGGNQVGSGINFLTPGLSQTTIFYVESNNGCASSRVEVKAIIHDIPSPPVAADSSRCGTGPVDLYAIANYQVFWYSTPVGGTAIGSGSLFTTPSLTQTTTYYTNDIDVCGSSRIPVVANVKPLPASPIGQDGVVCGTGIVQLTAASSDSIYWFDQSNGGNLLSTGSNFITPVIHATTVYYAIAMNDCPSYPTPVTAIVTPGPPVFLGLDTTLLSGATMILDAGAGFDSYLWSTGETTQTIVVNITGNYSVEATLSGCVGYDEINVNFLVGVQETSLWNGKINIYPNPAKDNLTIETIGIKDINAAVSIIDIAGRILIKKDIQLHSGLNTQTFDLSGLAKGMYFLTLHSADSSITLNVLVE